MKYAKHPGQLHSVTSPPFNRYTEIKVNYSIQDIQEAKAAAFYLQ